MCFVWICLAYALLGGRESHAGRRSHGVGWWDQERVRCDQTVFDWKPIRARWSEISNRSHSRRWTEKEKNVIWSQWHSRDPRALFRRNKHGTDGLPRSCYNALNVRITQNWGRHNRLKFHHASELVNSSVDCFQYKIQAYFFTIVGRG